MSKNDEFFHKNEYLAYTKERGFIMKNIIRKSIATIVVIALTLTLAMPVTAEAATKKAPKLNKSKVTLTITKKKTKPTVQLKVKNTAGNRTLKCKVTVKDKRKAVSNKPNNNTDNSNTICQHTWEYYYGSKQIYVCIICNGCNKHFADMKEFQNHDAEMITQNDINHGGWHECDEHGFISDNYKYCTKCGIKETIN